MSKPRTANFSIPEDKYLASIFLDISQDPIFSNNQSMQELWKHICDKYHAEKPSSQIQDRSQRSLQSRWSTMLKDTRKFNGCLRQVEYQNPSGASEQTISIVGRSSFHEERTPESPDPSLSSFHINLDDNASNISSGSSQRPEGVKKVKGKRKQAEDSSHFTKIFSEDNEKLRQVF